MSKLADFINTTISMFKRAKLDETPHRSIYEAATQHGLEVTINGVKPENWNAKTEDQFWESGDETLKVVIKRPEKGKVVLYWADERTLIEK